MTEQQIIQIILNKLDKIDDKTDKHGEQLARLDSKLDSYVHRTDCEALRSHSKSLWEDHKGKIVVGLVGFIGAVVVALVKVLA